LIYQYIPSNILHIDLSSNKFWVEKRQDLFEKYIGGTGIAIQLLQENWPKECDPFSPENPIVFAVGPLTGLFPLASKTVAMFKSPHTGNLGESHCGGRSAVAIRMAGYGAIVIKGISNNPTYLAIHGSKVHFRDASTIWGMESIFTVGRIIRENEPGSGLRTIMRIGSAGERLVSYACVTTETYRHFGRLGLGAVFGSKKLKAVVVSGKRSLKIKDSKRYQNVYDEVYNSAVNSPIMQKYHDLGTSENILPLNELGGLPTRNLQTARFENASKISGEVLAQEYLGRRLACSHCPIGCIHIAALREPYGDERYFYKTSMICYDYEPMYALGTMLGISEPEGFLKLMDQVEKRGLDSMSTGVVLAWATEALEKGIITEKETKGIKLRWGDYNSYIEAVKSIVDKSDGFYNALAHGVEYAASKYGGKDFALSFMGNEMPGYHTGPGAHVGVFIGARHSHLDNAGYSIDQKILVNRTLTPDELVENLLKEEYWRQILSSLAVCFFARGVYTADIVLKTLQTVGYNLTENDLHKIGEEIHREKYKFKIREGFNFDDFHIPNRIFDTPTPIGEFDRDFVVDAVKIIKKKIS
jgi:aldehyde:ferredoxin oxidoreductase